MLVELRPTDKLRNSNSSVVGAVVGSILHAVEADAIDLSHLRVVCDWIQYKKNFRDPVEIRPIISGPGPEGLEIAVDLRRGLAKEADFDGELTRALARRQDAKRLYLEPWSPTTQSLIWNFNAIYWKNLALWESITGRSYESALPGGESDALNTASVRETILELFAIWDQLAARRALPDQLHVVELGVGNGNQARVWLDEFVNLDREQGKDYYRRLHYLMGDYSPHLLDIARNNVAKHADHISGLVLEAMQPSKTLGFLKYKAFFVYISNVYDNLPTDEIARVNGHNFQVETRAFLSAESAERIAGDFGIALDLLPEYVTKLLRLGPELVAETYRDAFAGVPDVVRFWHVVWDAVGLEERYVPLQPLDQYEVAPGTSGVIMRSILEADGDVRMHVSNGALASFVDTLPLLHPHGFVQCHDLFVIETEQYATGFRGPGKYDGSVVNWVNGPLLRAVGARRGFDVGFRKFAHRDKSNIITMTARVRE
ncbi:MAG TPA: SAM-dependent methyltransferase [Candidatus Binatia bacterium]|nr:SAM-dependent methyltransferase [Candidatus Binatia bacterium]